MRSKFNAIACLSYAKYCEGKSTFSCPKTLKNSHPIVKKPDFWLRSCTKPQTRPTDKARRKWFAFLCKPAAYHECTLENWNTSGCHCLANARKTYEFKALNLRPTLVIRSLHVHIIIPVGFQSSLVRFIAQTVCSLTITDFCFGRVESSVSHLDFKCGYFKTHVPMLRMRNEETPLIG